MSLTPAEFRCGQHSIPLQLQDELPDCCPGCPYLAYEEFTVCFIDAPFYLHCVYHETEQRPGQPPPCLAGEAAGFKA